ncbi:MAG: M4 family metallopeptidase [bacterium]|nr:M4 family metallopeptidase [bacterium]
MPGLGAIRDMWHPTCFGDPGKTSDSAQFVCGDPGNDNGGVHTNSGVPNHAFALMVDGGTYNLITVAPLGLAKAGKIQYRSLAHYLTSASDFLDNYNALKQSCQDLIGTAGITAADCDEVGKALDAVEMSDPWPCSTPNPQAAVPALCTPPASPNIEYFSDLEGAETCPSATLPTAWCLNGPMSLLGAYATSGTGSMWGYNRPAAGSMAVTVSNPGPLSAGAKLQFNHSYGFENSAGTFWDGGVVEYSTTGIAGPFIDAGSKITSGATYDGPISNLWGNPLAGGNAFVADSWGYTATQMDFAAQAGQTIALQFRIGTDISVDDFGWFVDDILWYTCAECLADRVLTSLYNGTASHYKASNSITAGSGFEVGLAEDVTFEAGGSIVLEDGFSVDGGDFTAVITPGLCP